MLHNPLLLLALVTAFAVTALAPAGSLAQTAAADSAAQQDAALPVYKPPPRGAPGGRVGGASRGTVKLAAANPTIELLAPRDHTGLSLSPTPTLYYYVSGPVLWPTRFTIRAPGRPAPVLEINIPPPRGAGVYALSVADYRVRLEPGIIYTWSVSVVLDPKTPARDVVASASLLVTATGLPLVDASRATPAPRRAGAFAQAGLWYDAVAAAAAAEPFDRHVALDALMTEVGLVAPAESDRRHAGPAPLGR